MAGWERRVRQGNGRPAECKTVLQKTSLPPLPLTRLMHQEQPMTASQAASLELFEQSVLAAFPQVPAKEAASAMFRQVEVLPLSHQSQAVLPRQLVAAKGRASREREKTQ